MGVFVCVYGVTNIKGKARLLTVITLVGFLLFDMRFCFVLFCNKCFFKCGLQICCTLQSFGYTFVLLFLGKCYYLLCRYEKKLLDCIFPAWVSEFQVHLLPPDLIYFAKRHKRKGGEAVILRSRRSKWLWRDRATFVRFCVSLFFRLRCVLFITGLLCDFPRHVSPAFFFACVSFMIQTMNGNWLFRVELVRKRTNFLLIWFAKPKTFQNS